MVLIVQIPKGFFPQQDTGAIVGGVQGPQDASFAVMNNSVQQAGGGDQGRSSGAECDRLTGGTGDNGGFIYIALKPLNERKDRARSEIINRLRPKLNRLPVASAFLQAAQDLRIGGRAATRYISTRSSRTTWRNWSTGGRSCWRNARNCRDFRM